MTVPTAGGFGPTAGGATRSHRATPRVAVVLALLGALAAAAVPFLVRIRAWPEIAAPAYFLSRGGVLYDTIFYPHTPVLIATLAALGRLVGFSGGLFRGAVSASMAATAAVLVLGLERRRGFSFAAAVGVASAILWQAHMEGLAVFPDPLLPPVILGAAILLERSETARSRGPLVAGGFLLGIAILVKQTSAWVALAALVWIVLRRRPLRDAAALAGSIAVPYLLFVLLWGAWFRTTAHVYWTLVVPVFSSHAAEIRDTGGLADAYEALGPFLVVPAVVLLELAAGTRRLSAPVVLAVGVIGMAWPRAGLLHLSAAVGLIAFLTARSCLLAVSIFGRWHAGELPRPRLAAGVGGAALLVSGLGVALLSGGSILAEERGGEVFYWDDPLTLLLEKELRAHASPGQTVFLYNTNRDNLYARTSTRPPGGIYVNTSFWYYFDKGGVGRRVTDSLREFPGWVLHREPNPTESGLRSTEVYRFLASRSEAAETASDSMTWRRIRPGARGGAAAAEAAAPAGSGAP